MPRKSVSETVRLVRTHTHTASLFEELGLITRASAIPHNPLLYTNLHNHQMNLVKTVFRAEALNHSILEKAVLSLKACAKLDFAAALSLAREHNALLNDELEWARTAISVLSGYNPQYSEDVFLKRHQVARELSISVDTLRNWELNNLIDVDRSENGYRIYNREDISVLGIIRVLRSAGLSLSEISEMMKDYAPQLGSEEIRTICSALHANLMSAKTDAEQMITILKKISAQFNELK